jgi:alkanesulfonate monooxygenase SsuD/methylene tetrahydromethanopterin reductase-like flavin-dependent oxidoreductase (luciferase family)
MNADPQEAFMAAEKLTFGVLLPTRGVILQARDVPDLSPIFDLAQAAEDTGYDSVWVGDSVLAKSRLDALTTMGALSARTRRVRIGTAVLLATLRHPVPLAHTLASLDVLSGGRIIAGIGVGRTEPLLEHESESCGVPFKTRATRLEESLEIMTRLWAGERLDFSGEIFTLNKVELLPRPVQKPRIPIWLASNLVERGLKRVALRGDGWITNVPSPDTYRTCWQKIEGYAKGAGADAGRLKKVLYLTVHVGSDGKKAREEGSQFLANYYHKAPGEMEKLLVTTMGSPEECLKTIGSYRALGVTTFIIRFAAKDQMGQLTLWSEEVLPHA